MHENQDNVTLEIGHVLFLDIVGYSKLLINGGMVAVFTSNKAGAVLEM